MDPLVRDAATWANHVGVSGAEGLVQTILSREDVALDAIDYPNNLGTRSAVEILDDIASQLPGLLDQASALLPASGAASVIKLVDGLIRLVETRSR